MSLRYYGSDAFILNSNVFQKDTGTSNILSYLCDTTNEKNSEMETFLSEYTNNIEPTLDYESKESYLENFHNFKNTFLFLGSILSGIIGLVGILMA